MNGVSLKTQRGLLSIGERCLEEKHSHEEHATILKLQKIEKKSAVGIWFLLTTTLSTMAKSRDDNNMAARTSLLGLGKLAAKTVEWRGGHRYYESIVFFKLARARGQTFLNRLFF